MRCVFLEAPTLYDGQQLATFFMDRHAPDEDDAILLFVGEADVPVEHMVDLEDAEAGDTIYSPLMAHCLVEHRGIELLAGVLCQRLLMRLMADWLGRRTGRVPEVRGDDLFVDGRKLSVSVATTSPRGVLVHAGVNVDTEGTPVPTAGLSELRVRAREFLQEVGRAYCAEIDSVRHAMSKVRSAP